MTKIILHQKSIITLHTLDTRKEGKEYIIGRKETGIYITIPVVGYAIIKLLQKKKTLFDVKKTIQKKYGNFDVESFVHGLIKYNFVYNIDHHTLEKKSKKIRTLFTFLHQDKVQFLFSPLARIVYILSIASAIVLLLSHPDYFPKAVDYFFTEKYMLLILFSFLITWILVYLHEFAHFIAARSVNIPCTFGLSSRLFFLVATTDVTGIYSLEKKKRFRVLNAGIILDLLLLSFGIILLYLHTTSILSLGVLAIKLIKFMILLEFFGIMWQFMFFMDTDIYYIFENMFDVHNLHEKTKNFIKNSIYKLMDKKHHFSHYFDTVKERRIVKFYSLFFFIGMTISLYFFFTLSLPIFLNLMKGSITSFITGLKDFNLSLFYDSGAFLLIIFINLTLFFFSIIKQYHLIKKPLLYYAYMILLITCSYLAVFVFILFFVIMSKNIFLTYALLFLHILIFASFLSFLFKKLTTEHLLEYR